MEHAKNLKENEKETNTGDSSIGEDAFFEEEDQSIDQSSSSSSIENVNADGLSSSKTSMLPLPLFSSTSNSRLEVGEIEVQDEDLPTDSAAMTTSNFSLQMMMLAKNNKSATLDNGSSTIKKRLRQSTYNNRTMNIAEKNTTVSP
jgi:hypothetical protein